MLRGTCEVVPQSGINVTVPVSKRPRPLEVVISTISASCRMFCRMDQPFRFVDRMSGGPET